VNLDNKSITTRCCW